MNGKKLVHSFSLKIFFTKNQLFILLLSNLMISSASSADVKRDITTQINSSFSPLDISSLPSPTPGRSIVNIKSGGSINVTGYKTYLHPTAFKLNESPVTININADVGKGIIADTGYAIANSDNPTISEGLEINLNSGLIASSRGNAILIGGTNQKFTINTSVNTSISAYGTAIESNSNTTSILTVENSGNISGATAIKSNGIRSLDLANSGTIDGNISATTGKLTIANTAGSITGNIDLGSNSESFITLSNGSIAGDVLMGNNSQIINLNGGTYLGNINGSSTSLGTVNINSNQTLNSSSSIGSANSINNLNINSGALLTLNSSRVSAANIALSGSLNLGNTATTVTGNVIGSGSGLLNVGSAFHAVNGNLTLNSGDTLKVLVANDGDVSGKATVSGLTTVGSGVKLEVGFASSLNNYKYITDDKRYTIIDGASGSSINAIADSNMNINKFSVFTLSTSTADNDLFLDVARKSAAEVTTNELAQSTYTALNTIGDSATGSLKEIQQYIDSSDSAAEVESALKSIAPQVDNGILLGAVTVVNNSVATVENRLDALRNGDQSSHQFRANNYSSTDPMKTSASKDRFVFGGDAYQDIQAWSQTFGTSAKQGDLGSNDGYKSRALGFAVGYDKEISKNTRLGMSLNYANSAVTGKNSLKRTDIDTYQINAYGSKSFGKYFMDSIIGFSWNEYSSKRKISAVGAQANGNYSGQNYVARIRTGVNHNLGGGFTLSPNASLNYIQNTTGNYTETGADTLSLQVKGSSANFFEARVGTTLSYETMGAKGTKITPKISASYGYNFLRSSQTISGNFVGQSVTFNTVSAKLDPKSLIVGTGVDLYDLDSITVSADYSMEKKQKYQSHSGVLKFRYNF